MEQYETVFGIGWATGPVIAGMVSQIFGNEIPCWCSV